MIMRPFRCGIIADTHGFLSMAVHRIFENVDEIFHAGDIGDEHFYFNR